MRKIKLKSHYDLIVVGGGIQGCAMVWEAQGRGLNTLLVEAQDYCSQTSANSLKTIHGGIRYLQTFNLSRTLRSAKEQEILLKIAPHLVHPLACLLPTESKLKRSRLAVTAGFSAYNLLKRFSCPVRKLKNARCLSKQELREHTQLLDLEKVTGAGLWYDAQVQHTERLGLAFVKTAQASGADAYNYLKAMTVATINKQQFQLDLECQISQEYLQVSADSVIFCTASNTFETLSEYELGTENWPGFSLAVNLVMNNSYADFAVGLQSGFSQKKSTGSSRLLFAAPWRNSGLFGTWYFDVESSLSRPGKEQIEFCLADINQTYPKLNLQMDDIKSVHAGLLPINNENPDPEDDLMETDFIHQIDHALNLFAVIPTKYTTCRAIAQQTIDKLGQSTSKTVGASISAKRPLIGGNLENNLDETLFELQEQHGQNISESVIEQLFTNYGDQINEVIGLCIKNNELAEVIPGSKNHIKAQLEYELVHGQVENISDFVLRRSFLGSDGRNREMLEYCAQQLNRFHNRELNSNTEIELLLNSTVY